MVAIGGASHLGTLVAVELGLRWMCQRITFPPVASHLEDGSGYFHLGPTRLDEIKNLHAEIHTGAGGTSRRPHSVVGRRRSLPELKWC